MREGSTIVMKQVSESQGSLTLKAKVMNEEIKTLTITCYGKTTRYPESKRKDMINEFLMGMISCDGSEKERYTNIYIDLVNGAKICSDSD